MQFKVSLDSINTLAVLESIIIVSCRFKGLGFKVCGPYVATLLNWTPSFEWYMARLVVKNAQ